MFIELLKPELIHHNLIQIEKKQEQINGKIVNDIEIAKYEKDGDMIIKGHYNKSPIYYKRRITPKFRNKHVRFNISTIKKPSKINRTPTPFIHEQYPIKKPQTLKNKIQLIEKINKHIKSRKRRINKKFKTISKD
jgi:hypothetical protein